MGPCRGHECSRCRNYDQDHRPLRLVGSGGRGFGWLYTKPAENQELRVYRAA